ncbi:MAG: hypothetical protein NT120_01010 [Candidatus Aenigmarchaeota archaeon]|nr:hypothetical protein [Candidatus Aenigmarchaeota archaeon]
MIAEKSPVRITFGSCGDTDYYMNLIGWGNTVNAAVNMFSYCSIDERTDGKIVIKSMETGDEIAFDALEDMNFDVRELNLTKVIIKHYGNTGIEVKTWTDAPLESGLGGSAAHAIAVIKAFNKFNDIIMPPTQVARLAYHLERNVCGVAGGYQDQWASAIGGLNYMKFANRRVETKRLNLSQADLKSLEDKLLLVYIKRETKGKDIHKEQKEKKSEVIDVLIDRRGNVEKIRASLEEGRFEDFGRLMHKDWILKKNLATSISNARVEDVYSAAMDAGALGGRFLGAGGGGCAVFFSKNQEKIMDAIAPFGAKRINFSFVG